MHKAFPLLVRKFPLPEGTSHCLKMNATVRRIEMPLPEVCTTIEEKKKKLPVKDRWQAWRETLILGEFPSIHTSLSLFNSQKKMDHQYPTVAKIPVLDTGMFEQWQFRIQEYLQHEHYALWEVIEFGDSYKVPTNTDPDNTTTRKDDELSGRTKISIQGSDVAGFDKSKVECFNCQKMGHFARECRAPRSQKRGRKENYRQGSKAEEKTPKALMAIDGVGWDWSYMANEGEDHALAFVYCSNTSAEGQNKDSSTSEDAASPNTPKPFVKKSCFNCGDFSHLDNDYRKRVQRDTTRTQKHAYESPSHRSDGHIPHDAPMRPPHRSDGHILHGASMRPSHRPTSHRPHGPSMNPMRPNVNSARPNISFFIQAHSYENRHFLKSSAVKTQYRAPWVPTVNRNNLPVNRKFFAGRRNFPTVNRKFPTASRKFTTGSTKTHIADMGRKGKAGSSQNNIDDKGYWDCGCSRHMTGNISYLSDFKPFDGGTPKQHNMYSIDLNNIVPHKDLTCLVAKASADKCILWHRRLGYLNVKTMNKLVRHNLVRGLPTKSFDNDHTCTACLKGKQHKASCKSKLVNSVTKPLYMLHMDLFGSTSVSSISHKWYCLVVTDDFSRFTWTFFLRSKDETSDILKKFITKIKNLKDLKVKIIRCDNEGEFRNKEMNDFCSQKGIKREFSNARTPQENGVAERRNRTLIEAARTMLADAKLPVTFWAEAINTACYVQNRVLVNKTQNKTPYELFNGRTPAIGFLKPFGYHVMILNTLDNLGKFEAKEDEGYFIGYSMSSKAFRVFNKRTRRVKENLHVEFLENKAIEKSAGPNWLFDIDSLTKSMNYVPVDAGTNSTNFLGTKDAANEEVKKDVSSLRYILLPNWAHDALLESSSSKPHDESSTKIPKGSGNSNPTASSSNLPANQMKTLIVESPIPTVSSPVPTACLNDSPEPFSEARLISKRVANQEESPSLDNILSLTNRFEDILGVTTSSNEAIGVEAD
nr:retrovirus-related Pol polyprotein from transposon TNT 1-94 [Tanacetum cinerariifolium]